MTVPRFSTVYSTYPGNAAKSWVKLPLEVWLSLLKCKRTHSLLNTNLQMHFNLHHIKNKIPEQKDVYLMYWNLKQIHVYYSCTFVYSSLLVFSFSSLLEFVLMITVLIVFIYSIKHTKNTKTTHKQIKFIYKIIYVMISDSRYTIVLIGKHLWCHCDISSSLNFWHQATLWTWSHVSGTKVLRLPDFRMIYFQNKFCFIYFCYIFCCSKLG